MTKQNEVETVAVRYNFPADVHQIIKNYKNRLQLIHERDVTMEEAMIDLIRNSKIPAIPLAKVS